MQFSNAESPMDTQKPPLEFSVKETETREEHPAPKVRLNPEVKDFYQFTTQNLIVEDYVTGEQIKNIPVAAQGEEK